MKKIIGFSIISTFLLGCSLPQTSSELANKSESATGLCYDLPISVVNERINNHLNSCHGSTESATYVAGMVIPLSIKQHILKENIPNGIRYSVRNRNTYLLTADVLPNFQSCKTFVKTSAVTGYWKRKLGSLDSAIKGVSNNCPSNLF